MEAPTESLGAPGGRIIFLRVQEASVFRTLLEFFHAALRNLVFVITSRGIRMRADNFKDAMNPETIMVDLDLPRQHFYTWSIPESVENDPTAELRIVVDAMNFRMATQGILKKDAMTLSVTEDEPNKLKVTIINENKGRNEEHCVTLKNWDSLPEESKRATLPCAYTITEPRAVAVAAEFQKACRAATPIKADRVRVFGQKNGVKFEATNDEVTKSFAYGRFEKDGPIIYDQQFEVKGNFGAIAKCCPMSKNVRFYFEGSKAMLISLNTGECGTLDIFLVPARQ